MALPLYIVCVDNRVSVEGACIHATLARLLGCDDVECLTCGVSVLLYASVQVCLCV